MIKYTPRTSTSKSYSLSGNNKEYTFKVKVEDDILKFKLTDGNDIYRGTYLIKDFLKLNDKYKLEIREMMDGKFLEDLDERVKNNELYFFGPKHGKLSIIFSPVNPEEKTSFNVNLFLENYNYVRDYPRDDIMLTKEQAEAFNKRGNIWFNPFKISKWY